MKNVNFKGNDLPDAIGSFPPKGKCCRSFAFFGHGYSNGALEMPYDIPNVAADENNSHLAHELGGPNKQKPGLQEHYNKFISKLKSVMCKSEAKVIFNSCYTALGIADNTFGSLGITTGGFTGVCSYPQDADKKKYYLPVPKEGGTSKYEEFKPEKEDSKPAESK